MSFIKNIFKKTAPSKDEMLGKKFSEEFGFSPIKLAAGNEFTKDLLISAICATPFNSQKAANALIRCGNNTPENIEKIRRLNTWYTS